MVHCHGHINAVYVRAKKKKKKKKKKKINVYSLHINESKAFNPYYIAHTSGLKCSSSFILYSRIVYIHCITELYLYIYVLDFCSFFFNSFSFSVYMLR